MKRLVLACLLIAALDGCSGTPPPPPRNEAKRLNSCGDLPAQPAELAEDERAIRIELRSNVASNYDVTGVCLNHRGRRINPVGNATLGALKDGPLVFEVHTIKTWTHFKFHFHATVKHIAGRVFTDWNDKTNLDADIRFADLPDNTVRLTLDVNGDRDLVTTSVPAPIPPSSGPKTVKQ